MPTITESVEDTVMPVQGRGYGSMPEGVKGATGTKNGKYITRKKKKKAKRKVSRSKSISNAAMSYGR